MLNKYRRLSGLALAGILAVVLFVTQLREGRSADHRDSSTAIGDRNADINDLYAWTTPSGNLVIALTLMPVATSSDYLNPDYLYQIKIDNDDADLVEDQVIQIKVDGTGPGQEFRVYGPAVPEVTGARSNRLLSGKPLKAGLNSIADNGTMKAFVGLRDDPFFFDLNRFGAVLDTIRSSGQAKIGFNNPGANFFAGLNTMAIVVEMPKSLVSGTSGTINVWATANKKNQE